jgi:hypothetical protein
MIWSNVKTVRAFTPAVRVMILKHACGHDVPRVTFSMRPVLGELEKILEASRAADAFKKAVRQYVANGQTDQIRVEGFAPHVKVKRLLTHVLSAEGHLPIERVSLRGRSGCSDFVGTVQLHTASGTHVYEFVWDCRWRAEQEGWTDCFGFPDQIRAAREYDWRCFERWEPVRQ